ncbi:MAG TPA: hypothetical protein VJL89_11660 [Thermodesulfovibrionia bacterium]|nr:hypothetical protein [Thermodesulfovibrionia bacterium]
MIGLVTLIIYASRGVGNPHTIFIARRNVPFILPIIYKEFGKNGVLVNYYQPVAAGNPSFAIKIAAFKP